MFIIDMGTIPKVRHCKSQQGDGKFHITSNTACKQNISNLPSFQRQLQQALYM